MLARLALPTLLLLPLLAGCLGEPATPAATAGPGADLAERPEVALPTFLPPIELGTVPLGAEPSVAVGQDGVVYVVTPLSLWRSEDHARTFAPVGPAVCMEPLPPQLPCPPGFEQHNPGLVGGGDASLAVAADGTVWWAGLGGGHGIPVQSSRDLGESWSEVFDAAEGVFGDREWVVVNRTGTVFVSWRGSVGDESLILVRSTSDAGATWTDITPVAEDGRQGPIATDPTSDWLLLPHTVDGGLYVARSGDGGATWEDAPVAPVNGRPFIFPIATFDDAGTAYFVWSEDPQAPPVDEPVNRWLSIPSVFMSVSHDKGASWSEPIMLSTPDVPAVFPWVAAGAPGRVVVAWYEGELSLPSGRTPNEWHVTVAMSTTADLAEPAFATARPHPEAVHVGALCTEGLFCSLTGGDRSMLDFFEVRILDDGSPVVAYAADADARMATVKVFTTRMEAGTPLR